MKFFKYLICKCLCINNFNINPHITYINNYLNTVDNINLPKKYISFKSTKKNLFKSGIYFDIYDNHDNHDNHECDYNFNNKYKKYNDLTAEHVFPQSYMKNYEKAKFDMHNIYLTSAINNNYRSNYKFYDEDEFLININDNDFIKLPKKKYELYNNYTNYRSNDLKIFIPNYYSRGMIARSIAYIKLNYKNVNIENVIDINTLKTWNKLYPPYKNEKYRNEYIVKIQGNSNIFIENYLLIDEFFYNK
tara:strand:- start:9366 stop:10106 length:741 start_codon:yes stop_codon:yes gene_type:complete